MFERGAKVDLAFLSVGELTPTCTMTRVGLVSRADVDSLTEAGAVTVVDLLREWFEKFEADQKERHASDEDERCGAVQNPATRETGDGHEDDDPEYSTDREAQDSIEGSSPFGVRTTATGDADPWATTTLFVAELTSNDEDGSKVLQRDGESELGDESRST